MSELSGINSKADGLDQNQSIDQIFNKLNKISKSLKVYDKIIDDDVPYSHVIKKLEEALDGNTSLSNRVTNLKVSGSSSSTNTDEKVKVDSGSVAGYLGTTGSNGVLRVNSTLGYTNGGNYATLSLDSTLKSNYDSAYSHISADGKSHSDVVLNNTHRASNGSDHSYIDQAVTIAASPTHADLKLTNPTADTLLKTNSTGWLTSIADGSAGEFLTTNGAGVYSWAAAGGGSPGGANTNVQYNNAGAFGGDAGFTYNGAGTVYASVAYNTVANTGVYQIGGADILGFDTHGLYVGSSITRVGSGASNVFVGINIGSGATSSANKNVAVGIYNLTLLTTGDNNTVIGESCGYSISSGLNNTLMGRYCGVSVSTGSYNTILGAKAGLSVTTASKLTIVGASAGRAISSGTDNLIFGYNVARNLTVGNHNIIFAEDSLDRLVSGSGNIGLGYRALNSLTDSYNVGVGYSAGQSNTTMGGAVSIGYRACYGSGSSSPLGGVCIGYDAGYAGLGSAVGNYNVLIGYRAAGVSANGLSSTVIVGAFSGEYNTSTANVFLGYISAMNSTGGYNTFVGYSTGANSGAADYCVYLGYRAGLNSTTSQRLFIATSGTTTPLVYGEFDNGILRIHGNLEYNDPSFTRCDGYVMRKPAEVSTTDATQTTLDSITLLDENVYHVKAFVTSVKSDGSDRASYEIACTVYRTGAGNATLQGAVTVISSQESDATWDATFTVNGNDLRLSVTGVAATTIRWAGTMHYINTSN